MGNDQLGELSDEVVKDLGATDLEASTKTAFAGTIASQMASFKAGAFKALSKNDPKYVARNAIPGITPAKSQKLSRAGRAKGERDCSLVP